MCICNVHVHCIHIKNVLYIDYLKNVYPEKYESLISNQDKLVLEKGCVCTLFLLH